MAVDAALRHIAENLGKDHIELDEDLYWEVPFPDLFNLRKSPVELEVGNLSDDLEFLDAIQSEPKNATALSLVHIFPLLRYLAHKVDG
ncbi:hypothetical protein ABE85_19890 [Mitsuaria sp. 7]|nr:hypothetical protein ABE85_19890 [Mitsuaria sp. 7]